MRYFFIVNPAAGNGRAKHVWNQLHDILLANHIDFGYALTTEPKDATAMAADIASAGYDSIVAVGGDGTLHEIVAGVPPHTVLGVIPAGTGNDFARMVGMPMQPAAAWQALQNAEQVAIDCGLVNGHPFLNIAGLGFDAQVAQHMQHRKFGARGMWSYLLAVVRVLFSFKSPHITVEIDKKQFDYNVLLLAVGNGTYLGGGMRMCPNADIHDGLLDVCIIENVNRLQILYHLPKILRGTHIHHQKVHYTKARHIKVSGDTVPFHADGELIGHVPVEFSIKPKHLYLLRPSSPSS